MSKEQRRARGDDSVYYDKSRDRWVGALNMGYGPDGKRLPRPKVYGKTETEARAKLRAKRKEIDNAGGISTPERYTVGEAVEDWYTVWSRGKAENTRTKVRTYINKAIKPHIGAAKLKKLTADDVDKWLVKYASTPSELHKRCPSNSSIRMSLQILRDAIKHAQRRNKVDAGRNVAELVTELPEGGEGRPSKAMNLDQLRQTLEQLEDHPTYAYYVLTAFTGIRPEEGRALYWDQIVARVDDEWKPVLDVGWKHEVIAVYVWRADRETGETKTKKSRRFLKLARVVVDALRDHSAKEELRGVTPALGALVFPSAQGRVRGARLMQQALRRAAKRAKLDGDWSVRELRHSFVSILSASGMTIEEVSRLVGHSSTRTTEQVYHRELRPVLQEGAATVDRVLNPKPKMAARVAWLND